MFCMWPFQWISVQKLLDSSDTKSEHKKVENLIFPFIAVIFFQIRWFYCFNPGSHEHLLSSTVYKATFMFRGRESYLIGG